jgi:hypothetical protein
MLAVPYSVREFSKKTPSYSMGCANILGSFDSAPITLVRCNSSRRCAQDDRSYKVLVTTGILAQQK